MRGVWSKQSVINLVVLLVLVRAVPAQGQLTSSAYATGFSSPIAFVQNPTDPTVQLVVEQGGRVRVVRNGVVLATDFLDLRTVITAGGESGLLGLAFAPDYASSGRFYVNFTNLNGHTVIARFRRSSNPLVADPASRFDLRWGGNAGARFIVQPFANHNGGHLAFGPDGYLYIALGDGGSGNDPQHLAQNPQELLGKMLRIDVNVLDSDPNGYRIPPDNPFLDGVPIAARGEIWSFGLRNPWRYSFDDPTRGGTGALVLGDVGQGALEEINYEPSGRGGRNYGWRNREGNRDNITSLPAAFQPLTEPIHTYPRSAGTSVTGGVVYRGRSLGAGFVGRYFFADFVSGRIWSMGLSLDPVTGDAVAQTPIEHTASLGSPGNISSFGVDADGELYLVVYSGSVRKIGALPGSITASPAALQFAATKTGATLGSVTAAQSVRVSFGGAAGAWTATANQPWLQLTQASASGAGELMVGIVNPGDAIGSAPSLTGAITIVATATGASIAVPVTLTIRPTAGTTAPFGAFDTPVDGATVSGSIAVSGWAIDDIGVSRVEIWRDVASGETTPPFVGPGLGQGKIFVANAFFVGGARPDVEAAYQSLPRASQAGWGYLLLTQGLWNRGNGTFTLHAVAYDADGHSRTLGSKTITVNNAFAIKPFGAIDTPAYGALMTTSFWNYGWALTPAAAASCTIGPAGVQVSIDSGPLQPVSYGDLRPDIAAAFPGSTNAGGAGGAFYIDTTALADGTHQIGWLVTDSCGRVDGIGSRFFAVLNGGGAITTADVPASMTFANDPAMSIARGPALFDAPVEVRRGLHSRFVHPGLAGERVVTIGRSERIEVHLPQRDAIYTGYQIVNGERRALPQGSSLDAEHGIFYWQPDAAFLGSYHLAFLTSSDGVPVRVRAVVGTSVQAAIDTPRSGVVDASLTIAGWAIDLAAEHGTGIDTVHVWAHPVTGAPPTFLGVAAYGDGRHDVGALFGGQFTGASFSLAVEGLARGAYDIVIYPHSAVTGDFRGARVVRVTVR